MASKVLMEALSPTMEEGRLVEWKKKEGDPVRIGDVIAEVETDKAVMELVARAEGVLLKQLVPAGATVAVAKLVGIVGQPGEDISALTGGAPAQASASKPVPAVAPAPLPSSPAAPLTTAPPPTAPGGRTKASPLAKKVARERGLDLGAIAGSGPEGRIVLRDLDKATPATAAASAAPVAGSFNDVPLTQIRKTIAKRLALSIGPIPTFYLTTEVDMDRTWEAREALNSAGQRGSEAGTKISFNDIVMKATAAALKAHPACNAWWQDDRIRYWNDVHLSVAVAVEDGLITPVVRNADRKSLREISAEVKELAGRAKERRLKPEEYTGGTFSVSNLGMFDIDQFTAIINPPEAGILAVGSIVEQAVVKQGAVVPGRRLRLTMSCDHRVIDGATGAAFLRTLKGMLENPLAIVY
ncbi:MAG TPA: dihydrolipoamide acetyltransferase family protein [Gemmatimonadales bacterium]|nr:dihydrolipoamide acetyltransferase family protein [Gemmatimonadales bacterium]